MLGGGWDTTEEAVTEWILERNRYHRYVFEYFAKRPDDLLVINFIRDPNAGEKICKFLGLSYSPPKPKSNVTAYGKEYSEMHRELVNKVAKKLGLGASDFERDILSQSLLDVSDSNYWPADTSELI